MKEGIRYIVTKGNKDRSIQKGDHVIYRGNYIEIVEAGAVTFNKKIADSLNLIIDIEYYKDRIRTLKQQLKEAIIEYRSVIDERDNKSNKGNKS